MKFIHVLVAGLLAVTLSVCAPASTAQGGGAAAPTSFGCYTWPWLPWCM